MIRAEQFSYGFPQKDLYNQISFSLEEGQHCAFIGSNGTGKSTLIEILMDPEEYLYDGKLTIRPDSSIGYVSQFAKAEHDNPMTLMEYLCEDFRIMQEKINKICDEMGTTEDLESLMEAYQVLLDTFQGIDGDNHEINIRKQLKSANLEKHEQLEVGKLSGGEFKLVQVMREMLKCPNLLIMDEPDVFLDFENMESLTNLINGYKGTMLVITHNRYLLNHCFNKIWHLENEDLQEFEGGYIEYNFTLLEAKIEQQELAFKDEEEIARNKKLVEKLRKLAENYPDPAKGRALRARVSLIERLEARKIKQPFIDVKEPGIQFGEVAVAPVKSEPAQESQPAQSAEPAQETQPAEPIITLADYHLSFGKKLLDEVSFSIKVGEKVAIVGPNGTGKTTMLREIYQNFIQPSNETISFGEGVKAEYLSQVPGEMFDEKLTIFEEFEKIGFDTPKEVARYLQAYGFTQEGLEEQIGKLSGGEKNLLQLAKIARTDSNVLLLDEPNSHLDLYAQIALEKAIASYQGTVLMVSHDFYTIANCMDYVLWVEDQTIRRIRTRKFRQMMYANHFNKNYLALEQKKKEMEVQIHAALKAQDFEKAGLLAEELNVVVKQMQ